MLVGYVLCLLTTGNYRATQQQFPSVPIGDEKQTTFIERRETVRETLKN